MKIAERSRTEPGIPIHTGRNRLFRRTWTDATIGAIGPAMGFGNVPNDASPDEFAKAMVAAFAMALVAHLSGGFGLACHLTQFARFGNVVGERFLAINPLAEVDRQHRSQSMVMVWRGNY